MSRYKQIRFSLASLVLGSSLILGDGLPVYGQGVDVDGGQSLEAPKVLQIFGNRGPVEVVPPSPLASDEPTFSDPEGRLEIMIDQKHGYIKRLRFPQLFDQAEVRSIDRYLVLGGVSSSEFDDEVTRFKDNTPADIPHIV